MLHSAPRASLCAEAFMPIEADREAFSPGRVAAVGVRGQLAERRRASFLNVHVTLTHATRQYQNDIQPRACIAHAIGIRLARARESKV